MLGDASNFGYDKISNNEFVNSGQYRSGFDNRVKNILMNHEVHNEKFANAGWDNSQMHDNYEKWYNVGESYKKHHLKKHN